MKVCEICETPTKKVEPDYLDFCPLCDVIVEGNVKEVLECD